MEAYISQISSIKYPDFFTGRHFICSPYELCQNQEYASPDVIVVGHIIITFCPFPVETGMLYIFLFPSSLAL